MPFIWPKDQACTIYLAVGPNEFDTRDVSHFHWEDAETMKDDSFRVLEDHEQQNVLFAHFIYTDLLNNLDPLFYILIEITS